MGADVKQAMGKKFGGDDLVWLEGLTGASGQLADLAKVCHGMNNSLTKMMDALEGPDGTDTFDASCNTCAHFRRTPFDRRSRLVSVFGFPGTCAKTGQSVIGWPRGQYCGNPCYENRRTGVGGK